MNQNADTGDSLYRKDPKVYPRDVKGTFASLRKLAVIVLLGLYYILPWINWAGHQSVLFDLPARKFYILSLTFWPQDFIFLTLMLIIAGLALFFVTAVAGRLWCGYACPQTVWTEVFLWIERLVEGDRNKRMKLDKAPWNGNKILRKFTKQFLWITFALWTGFTFVGFFTPIRELGHSVITFQLGGWETFWLLFYGFATYGNAGILREQVCKYMCPYARFQSAMFDKDTLVIAYDDSRGEPRGGRRKTDNPVEKGLGDCIGCTLCVQVCPTGIDIREGLQIECIACAACIDVCDQVMDKMDYKKGLISYTTDHQLSMQETHVFRPRIFVYGFLLLVLTAGVIFSVNNRVLLRADLLRDRNALYRELADNYIENVYTLKLINMDFEAHQYNIEIVDNDDMVLFISPEPTLESEEVGNFILRIQAPASAGRGSVKVDVKFSTKEEPFVERTVSTRFLMPYE
ncbi:MAG: cytochrome c oxidase accessory protein CcoG [Gammaproteobacteria bacterium]|nr:cytochrome c oxidase accessory protein CcoG [Gammaproteobacteria bacterium]